MLNNEDNELLCRVGKGTPMGNLLRRFWLPALLTSEIETPDGPPKRIRVMGEDLLVFRAQVAIVRHALVVLVRDEVKNIFF